jgi:hypothetical protein
LGTGFLYVYRLEGSKTVPVVVTNRHVLADTNSVTFKVNKADNDGQPILGDTLTVSVDLRQAGWIAHPDSDVDLAIVPIAPVLHEMESRGSKPYVVYLSSVLIPSIQQWNQLTPIEDIIMIGYPIGISDTVNNLPTVRKGITATHPRINFNGKQQFLIDAAVFPGSSGSPVFILNEGSYPLQGGIAIGSRLLFLGIAYAYYYREGNRPVINEIPAEQEAADNIQIPINLGCVIKSSRLSEFEPILAELVGPRKDSQR